MAIDIKTYKATDFIVFDKIWSNTNNNYSSILVSSNYSYQQSDELYSSVSPYVLGSASTINNRQIVLSPSGIRTILKSNKISFPGNTTTQFASGAVVLLQESSVLESTDRLVFYIDFGEQLSFKVTDSIAVNNGIYYIYNGDV